MSELEQRVVRAMLNCAAWSSFWSEDDALVLARAALKAIAEGGYAIFDKSCLGSPPAQQEEQP